MKNRNLFLLTSGLAFPLLGAYAQKTPKPNIIYIMCDDMGYGDLGCYGQSYISTPNIDNMAKEGMRFTQAYAGSPVSAPSRASFMTGQHSGHCEVRGNKEYWRDAPVVMYGNNKEYAVVGQHPYDPGHVIIPEIMKDNGYTTGMFGKWAGGYEGSVSTPDKRGIDEYYGYICQFQAHLYYPNFLNRYSKSAGDTAVVRVVMDENINYPMFGKDYFKRPQYSADMIHEEAMKWLDKQDGKQPFFGIFTYTLPHAELAQPEDSILTGYQKKFFEDKTWGGQEGSRYNPSVHTHAQFAGMITRLDYYVGEVLNKLKEKGLDENTIVIFTSDNGPHEEGGADPTFFGRDGKLRGLKRQCYEGGIRIPFIVRWPGKVPEGTVNDHQLAFYDLMPTFCDLAGVKNYVKKYTNKKKDMDYFDGISFAPTLLGQEGQKKYDAISGASTSVTTNKNSDVIVEAAVLPDGQEPKNSDWKPLSEVITVNKNRTKINIDTEACGMEGVYSVHDSSLSLSGEPLKAGSYPISVTVTDESGRTATSNELNFKVYTRTEVLAKQLKLENCKQTADGKYMYDMEPWAIASFGGENETVTVPKDIKAWYGSHTSGTYGELGYAVDGSPVQTLIVPDGCNLTLVNMKVFSSVNIVVENGGKLVLRDSSIHGNIEVKNGGKFSSNYDDYGSQFLTGSSINGQLILNDGAILENSSIYSNTNFISNGHMIRQNTNPVIVVKGKVTVDGQVFVKGDEAATGQDETTGKSLSGQPAIRIENGSLDIKKDSVVAVFGGGYIATTSVGGSGIILDNGSISGEGTLIAFGGNGTYDDGADAISGNGTVSVKNVYAQGGCSSIPKTGSTAGKAIADGVTLAKTSNRTLLNGKEIKDNYGTISELYWSSITKVPDVSKYVIEVNGSDEEDNTKPGSSEDKPDTKPGASENKPNTKPGTSEKKPETKPASGSTVKKTIKTKSLKVKKTKVTLKKGKKYKIQAKKIPASSTAKIMYRSSNKRIAKVTKKGVIKALKKGKCKITVKTSDGKKKVIIVKVK